MQKNILLTGAPHSGKSTLLDRVVRHVPDAFGFLTRELKDVSDRRVGFELVGSNGYRATLAHELLASRYRVSQYGVDIGGLEIAAERYKNPPSGCLLYIDEIGEMELFSGSFRELVLAYMAAPNRFLGTLSSVYHDPFTQMLRARKDVRLIEVTPERRESVYRELADLLRT